ncbi:hypothetical protein WICPIJ_007554 [Wickerhamomyces pijperi]|uniref:Flavodoxin-like domain-containing protein n=1 Tax=Wickerhamomyces pijperi TaxID=599730 RepID=A0A9P8Q1G0_WICPI|nr:hypothetical protein WICPIJ_007554 [Wickerhamomyces pijperi]
MVKVAIIYHSQNGHTEAVAKSVHEGASSVEGVEAKLFTVQEVSTSEALHDLSDNYTALIFGTPTLMGSPSADFKKWEELTSGIFYTRGWANKIASGFTVSASKSGSKLNTLIDLSVFAAQHGMVWVPLNLPPGNNQSTTDDNVLNANSFFLGVGSQAPADKDASGLNPAELETGKFLGTRVAKLAKVYAPIANEF